jgi:hypothetical protein
MISDISCGWGGESRPCYFKNQKGETMALIEMTPQESQEKYQREKQEERVKLLATMAATIAAGLVGDEDAYNGGREPILYDRVPAVAITLATAILERLEAK